MAVAVAERPAARLWGDQAGKGRWLTPRLRGRFGSPVVGSEV